MVSFYPADYPTNIKPNDAAVRCSFSAAVCNTHWTTIYTTFCPAIFCAVHATVSPAYITAVHTPHWAAIRNPFPTTYPTTLFFSYLKAKYTTKHQPISAAVGTSVNFSDVSAISYSNYST